MLTDMALTTARQRTPLGPAYWRLWWARAVRTTGVAAFGLGVGEVVFSNASQSVLPQLVRAEQLPEANGNQYAVQTIGQEFAGPPLGSLLFTAAAAAVPFGVSAGSL